MKLRFFLLTMLALLGALETLYAHNGHVATAQAVSEIKIDGDLSDWSSELKTFPISKPLFLCDAVQTNEGFQGTYRVGYDYRQNALFVAVEIEDDKIVLDPLGQEAWSAQDGCELFLSLQHTGANTAPVQFAYRESPEAVYRNRVKPALHQALQVARASEDSRLVYEWRIDLKSLNTAFDASEGAVIGFDMAYLDRDTEDRYAFYSSSSGHWKHMNSDQLGDLVIPPRGKQLVQLAGKTQWNHPGSQPPQTLHLQSVENTAVFHKIPLAENGQFMLSLQPGEYRVTARGATSAAGTAPNLTIDKDTILDTPLTFDLDSVTPGETAIKDNAIVHYDVGHGQQPVAQLQALSQTLGFQLRVANTPLNIDTLQGADVLYLLGPTKPFTESEKSAVKTFLTSGGSMIVTMDESRRTSLSNTEVNDLTTPFGLRFGHDTEYTHNCGATANTGPISERCELPFSGGRAVEGGTPFGFQLDQDGDDSHAFATYQILPSGGRIILIGEAMAGLFLGSSDGERLSGTPRNYAETTYWGKDSVRFNTEIMKWMLAKETQEEFASTQSARFGD